MLWHRLTLLSITGASSYSHEGPLRPPKLMGKDKAVPVEVVENSIFQMCIVLSVHFCRVYRLQYR